jgi:hypothetical protein
MILIYLVVIYFMSTEGTYCNTMKILSNIIINWNIVIHGMTRVFHIINDVLFILIFVLLPLTPCFKISYRFLLDRYFEV